MAVDAYVTPLWKFKAGDFSPPLENALGIKPKVVSLGEPLDRPAPWYQRLLRRLGTVPNRRPTKIERRASARSDVATLKQQLGRLIGSPVDWPDDGGVVYNQQYRQGVLLRAFAAWHDHQTELAEFSKVDTGNYYEHPVWKLPEPVKRRFPTLVGHSLYTGYLIPVPFEGTYQVEPFVVAGHWEFFHAVSSSYTIHREVSELLQLASRKPVETRDRPWHISESFSYAEEHQRICALSIEHKLPVIFHG